MVAGVFEIMLPENPFAAHEEQAGHNPGIADGQTAGIALAGSAHTAGQGFRAEHFAQTTAFNGEALVEEYSFIRDCTSLRPETGEKSLTVLYRPLVEKQQRRIIGLLLNSATQIRHSLPAKDSTKMAQKHQQRRLLTDFATQSPGP